MDGAWEDLGGGVYDDGRPVETPPDWMSIEAHPVADIFPLMSDDEMTGLIEDIRSHGLREPIWLHPDGRIIDGRNRYRACTEGAVKPVFRTWSGEGSLIDFVLSLNLHRRHLNQSQKALVALRVEEQYAAEAKERQGQRTDLADDIPEILPESPTVRESRERAGKAVGVSGRYVSDAKRVAEQAPDLMPKIESGDMSVNEAKQRVASKPKSKRASNRQPLPEFAKSSGWQLRRAVERIERIAEDDRLSTYRTQVVAQLSDHLTYTVRACQEVLDRLTSQPQED